MRISRIIAGNSGCQYWKQYPNIVYTSKRETLVLSHHHFENCRLLQARIYIDRAMPPGGQILLLLFHHYNIIHRRVRCYIITLLDIISFVVVVVKSLNFSHHRRPCSLLDHRCHRHYRRYYRAFVVVAVVVVIVVAMALRRHCYSHRLRRHHHHRRRHHHHPAVYIFLFQVAPVETSYQLALTRIRTNAYRIRRFEFPFYEELVNIRTKRYQLMLDMYARLKRSTSVARDSEYCTWMKLLKPEEPCACTDVQTPKLKFDGCELKPIQPQTYHRWVWKLFYPQTYHRWVWKLFYPQAYHRWVWNI